MNSSNNDEDDVDDIPYLHRVVLEAGGGSDDLNVDDSSNDDMGSHSSEDGNVSDWSIGSSSEEDVIDIDYDSEEDCIPLHKEKTTIDDSFLELSDESKQLLTWRLDKDESFSDWTIEVHYEYELNLEFMVGEQNKKGREVKTYHVHRNILATGPKKSGYFEALLKSGQFSESSNNTSVVELPMDIAHKFEIFLDYLYSPPSECKCLINRYNHSSLLHLAKYFLVPRLSEDVYDFIKNDIQGIDQVEEYLIEFGNAEDDEAKKIITLAANTCAANILHIKPIEYAHDGHPLAHCNNNNQSSLLTTLSPAIFLHIIIEARKSRDFINLSTKKKDHICRLAISYFKLHHSDLNSNYFVAVVSELYLPYINHKNSGTLARHLLEIMNATGWEKNVPGVIKQYLTTALSKHISMGSNTADEMFKLTQFLSKRVVSDLFTEALNAKKKLDCELPVGDISCKLMSRRFGQPVGSSVTISAIKSTDTIKYILFVLCGYLNCTEIMCSGVQVFCDGKELNRHQLVCDAGTITVLEIHCK